MIPVSFYTLGCKLNQNETEALSDSFREEGFSIVPWDFSAENPKPLLCIINTCTVTSKAEQKARRIIRLCLNAGCIVLVTGCYAQLERDALEKLGKEKKMAGTLFIFPGQGKEKLLDLPRYLADTLNKSNISLRPLHEEKKDMLSRTPFSFNPQHFSFHSRAFLKIQDGCDFSCAYCRVPLARGKSISLDPQEALSRLQALEKKGMAEAVLTGVNICQYHSNENPPMALPGLITFLLDNTNSIALRLSSIEPVLCGDDFFAVLAHRRVRSHFHLSVQSGSDSVLADMGRFYRAKDIVRMVGQLRAIRDDPFIACDIITGFPGETEEDFEKTAHLCRSLDFTWIHAFPYSRRPGTRAAAIKEGRVSEKTARERLNVLLEIAKTGKSEYIRRWQGKITEAVAELPGSEPVQHGKKDNFFPIFPALTDNYIKVGISSDSYCKSIKPGTAITCRIGKAAQENGFDAWAELV